MPRPRKQLTAAEAIEQFGTRLAEVRTKPNINRYKPMPQQEIFHMSQCKNRIEFGGNRSGKTYSGIADDVLVLLRRHPYRQHLYADRPLRLRFIGVDFDRGIDQAAIPLFSQQIPPSALINGSWEDSYSRADHMLRLDDTSTVSFMSYEQDPNKFQAVSLDHIHFDEEPPEPIFRESRLRLLDTNGTWTMTETPVMQLEWVQDELIEPWEAGLSPDLDVIYLDTRDNIHLTAEALDQVTAGMSEEEKLVRLEGKYPPGKSMVFPEFSRKPPFIIPHELFVQQVRQDLRNWTFYESMDYGYVNPTAWIWTAVHQDGSIVTFHVRYAPRVFIEDWARLVLQTRVNLARQFGISESEFRERMGGTFGDPAIEKGANGETGRTVQQAYALAGVYIGTNGLYAARAGNANVGLDHMHKYLSIRPPEAGIPASTGQPGPQPWWQITDAGEEWDHAQNTALQDEMKKARTPRQTLKQAEVKNQSEQIRDKDNHAIDAQKYLFMMTHELRPVQFRTEASDFAKQFQANYGVASAPPPTVHDDFDASLSATTTDYSSLEY
jgi:phage terminase large subunit-like protein